VATFVLVHGAWHGAWCWDLVRPELQQRGHRVVAVDLPCDDVSSGLNEYTQVVSDALDEEAVVVGHSLGGLTIPLVAAARPVRKLVFLCALLPEPGVAFVDQLPGKPPVFVEGFGRDVARDDEGRSYWPEGTARAGMYPDCDEESAAWAIQRLRPQARPPNVEPCPLEAWPEVECAYLLGKHDRAVNPEWSRRVARERLGAEPIELDAGHSPFLTCPAALAEALIAA
jgi:pimeloyl-ACP methyl ester carboxylesterase